ncbi:GNAT family N-acetyltransferase [Microbacteriaceae bacterium 4G12]
MENVRIREIKITDAEKFLSLCRQLDQETEFMMLEPNERNITVNEQEKQIQDMLDNKHSTILVAEKEGCLIGYVGTYRENFNRCRHSAYVVTGILAAYRGRGIGTSLFKALERWTKDHNVHRLELTVMVHNKAGIALYKKSGFEVEGTKRHSLKIRNEFIDEYYMSKLT